MIRAGSWIPCKSGQSGDLDSFVSLVCVVEGERQRRYGRHVDFLGKWHDQLAIGEIDGLLTLVSTSVVGLVRKRIP